MKSLNTIALLLIIVGALNWGLIGFFNFNLVDNILGIQTTFTKIVYGLIGLCGLYGFSFFGKE
ncbi:DUF378 domain-containing protein [Clostridium tarantellae]|uniref:DUF378 domain-containing protein n=1 Tax=Clostridium tarantellae TaxID=39493 RepID=A0A6I1MR51_9CLOT|nr:DUF378 domain-containing protein [Clostridium tarantellae]MPQ44692.1 DUF378 domain-containing protein [Clostridium tarantellae]